MTLLTCLPPGELAGPHVLQALRLTTTDCGRGTLHESLSEEQRGYGSTTHSTDWYVFD